MHQRHKPLEGIVRNRARSVFEEFLSVFITFSGMSNWLSEDVSM